MEVDDEDRLSDKRREEHLIDEGHTKDCADEMVRVYLDWMEPLDEALAFARVLCRLGYGTLVVPQPDGRCLVYYQPKQ